MKANIGIQESHLQQVSLELNKLLADEFILQTKTRNYHWNIEGPNFSALHKFYDEQIKELESIIDQVAERIRAIGFHAEARLEDYLKLTSLTEQPYTTSQNDQLKNLLGSHETIIHNLRRLIPLMNTKYKDAGSSDFATQILVKHESLAWMIRAGLGG
ncbi:MAG TPA: Dps family protein [Bacteroidales bacterium]|nr:Dps family protein [Bacteroidales bacterium]